VSQWLLFYAQVQHPWSVSQWLLFGIKQQSLTRTSEVLDLSIKQQSLTHTSGVLTSTWLCSWIFTGIAHWNNSLWVVSLLQTDTLSWFQVNQSLHFFLNAVCLAEKQQIPFL
jgi:hypothetical protein